MNRPTPRQIQEWRKARRRRGRLLGLLLPTLILAVLGCFAFVAWQVGLFRPDASPAFLVPPPAPTPTHPEIVAWSRTRAAFVLIEPAGVQLEGSPWRNIFLVVPPALETLRESFPEAVPKGMRLSQAFVEPQGPLTLNLLAPSWPAGPCDIETERRILLAIGATALRLLPEASGMRLLINDRSRRVFIHHIAAEDPIPRDFFQEALDARPLP